GDELRRKFSRVHRRRVRDHIAVPEGDEMVSQRNQLSVAIETALEEMEAGRAVEIVLDVALSIPQELHRRADDLGDPGGLDHVVVPQAPTEASADARQVNGYV